MRFPGGKEAPGVFQTIINQIPPHSTYIEPFAGGGAILRLKRPAAASIAIDIDPRVADKLAMLHVSGLTVICGDACCFLKKYQWQGGEFVFCDPPYLMETRLSKKKIYPIEFSNPDQHLELLSILKTIPAMVMISSYWSDLYFETLQGWRLIDFPAATRSTFPMKEYLWMNYKDPSCLHDYRYIGGNFREREKIRRRQHRWRSRLIKMNQHERAALLLAMEDLKTSPPKKELPADSPLPLIEVLARAPLALNSVDFSTVPLKKSMGY